MVLVVLVVMFFGVAASIQADFGARDPGVRGGARARAAPLAGLTADENQMFTEGLADFSEEEGVADGLGPRFNFVGCAGCHAQPAVGGTSPAVNPLFASSATWASGQATSFPRSSRRTARSARRASSSTRTAAATAACTRSS